MKKITILILSVLLVLGVMLPVNMKNAQASNPLLSAWYYRTKEDPSTYSLKSVAMNGNSGVAVGENGVVLQTKDKTTWNLVPTTQEALSGVLYAKAKFFIVGQLGGIYYFDGYNTLFKITNAGRPLNGLVYGNNILVAYGQGGGAYSTNGTTWTKFALPTTAAMYCGTFGNSRFIIAGENGKIFISVDGKVWVETSDPKLTSNIYGLTFGKGTYLLAGSNQMLATSTEGHTWTPRTSAIQDGDFAGAIYANGHFITWSLFDATGMEDVVPNKKVVFYFASPDGKTWTNNGFYVDYTYVKSPWIYGITLGSDGYLYGAGDNGVIEKSKDGLRWNFLNSTTTSFFLDIVRNGSTYVAVGTEDHTDGAIFTSKDGYRWGQQNNPEVPTDPKNLYLFPMKSELYTVAYGKGTYVAGGAKGILMYSKNSVDWVIAKSPITADGIMQIEFVKDRFVGITNNGSIIASYDGVTWANGAIQKKDFMCISLAYDEKGNIVINGSQYSTSGSGVGTNALTKQSYSTSFNAASTAITPLSGIWSQTLVYHFNVSEINPLGGTKATWKAPKTVSDDAVKFMGVVCYGKGTFVMTGFNGHSFTSKDGGLTWKTNSAMALFGGMTAVTYGHNHFVAVGPNQKLATSPDGITWSLVNSGAGDGTWANSGNPQVEEFTSVFLSSAFSYILTSNLRILYATNGLENWMDMAEGGTYTLNDVTYAGSLGFIGAADSGFLLLSKDGATWWKLKVPACNDTITNISYISASGTVLVGTAYGALYATKDLVNWTHYNVPGGTCINTSATNGKTVLAITGDGAATAVLTSDINFKTWTFYKVNLGGTITGLAYANSYFVAVGDNGNIRYSKDGKTWTKASVATTSTFTAVARCGDRFVAVGVNGTIASSLTGYNNWTVVKTSFKDSLSDICYGGGIFLATSNGGKVYMSQNKTSWLMVKTLGYGNFYAGAVNTANVFVIVGENGLIMQSLAIKYL